VAEEGLGEIDEESGPVAHTRGPRWLCIDEAYNFAPQGKIMDPHCLLDQSELRKLQRRLRRNERAIGAIRARR
jgi:hypothetical protein